MKRNISPKRETLRERMSYLDTARPDTLVEEGLNFDRHFDFVPYDPLKRPEQRAMFARIRLFSPVSLNAPRKK